MTDATQTMIDAIKAFIARELAAVRTEVARMFSDMPAPERGPAGKDGESVKGEKGERGEDGKSVSVDDLRPHFHAAMARFELDFERRASDLVQRAVDRMPRPADGKDGINGKDGHDAFDLPDFQVTQHDDGRTLTLAFVRGEERKEFVIVLSHPIYLGQYKSGGKYSRGDCVTFGGSQFIAMRDTDSRPETDDSWRLAVKRGRDGKDGKDSTQVERSSVVRVGAQG